MSKSTRSRKVTQLGQRLSRLAAVQAVSALSGPLSSLWSAVLVSLGGLELVTLLLAAPRSVAARRGVAACQQET